MFFFLHFRGDLLNWRVLTCQKEDREQEKWRFPIDRLMIFSGSSLECVFFFFIRTESSQDRAGWAINDCRRALRAIQ